MQEKNDPAKKINIFVTIEPQFDAPVRKSTLQGSEWEVISRKSLIGFADLCVVRRPIDKIEVKGRSVICVW